MVALHLEAELAAFWKPSRTQCETFYTTNYRFTAKPSPNGIVVRDTNPKFRESGEHCELGSLS